MTPQDIFTARSTAMAVETQGFSREDLYTLFVTARVINFFKGISFEGSEMRVRDVLDRARDQGGRERLGAEILGRLEEEGVLYGAGKKELFPLSRFRDDLFAKVMARMGMITTLEGKRIRCDGWG